MNRIVIIISIILIPIFASAQEKPFEVSLINGVSLRANSIQIIDQGEENCHLSLDRSQNIPINLVRAFENRYGFYIVKDLPDKGPSIFQRTLNGPISIYLLYTTNWNKTPTGGGGLQTEKHQLYLFNNELKKLEAGNLKMDLQDQPKLIRRLKKLSKQHLVRTAGFFVSFGLMGYGVSQMFEYNPAETATEFNFSMNPPFLGGILALVATVGLTNKPSDSLIKIIQTYNYEQELQMQLDQ